MEAHLRFIGILLIVLALTHAIFPWYFKWREEQARLSLINRQVMRVHTAFIAFTVLLMGLLSYARAEALVNTELGRLICLGFGAFWGLRLLIQFFGYSPELWRGKAFETGVHVVFSCAWVYFTWVYLKVGLGGGG